MGMHDKYLKTRWSHFVALGVSLPLAYGFMYLAIDSGSYWHYLAVIVLLVFSVKCLRHIIQKPTSR